MIDSQYIKAAAIQTGFDACGIAAASPIAPRDFGLDGWLAKGCQADMRFMEEYRDMRHNPQLLLPGAKTVIAVLAGYKPSQMMQGSYKIAQYAYGEDYHERMKRMLYQLIDAIRSRYPDFDAKPCVDTAPISDKLWAARAGLGWIGHNTLLVNPKLGSYCTIGELVTTAEADTYDTPLANGCGDCHLCETVCPNQALHGCLDARRCASYHTIENRNPSLPADIKLSGYTFGCDCCQLACPYNQQAAVRYDLIDERKAQLESLPTADEATFKKLTKHTALSRIKFWQWQRNRNASGDPILGS